MHHMEEHCGKFQPSRAVEFYGTDTNDTEVRIVNGRKADFSIPWVVRLAIKKGNGKESICTGSILTAMHIITAAHCLCSRTTGRCMEEFSPNILTDVNRVFAYVGSPQLEEMERHRAKSAHVHPQYNAEGGAYDIAIIRLYVSIKISAKVRPICWPRPDTLDQNVTVYTAGWGLRYAQEREEDAVDTDNPRSSCLTNEIGPHSFVNCHGGWLACNRMALPPIDVQCLNWTKVAINSSTDDSNATKASIVQIQGDLNLTCYANPIGEYGWCYTRKSMLPWQWGYCSRSCMMPPIPLGELEYVTLRVVDGLKCDSSINEAVELCVGGLAPRAWVATYWAKLQGQLADKDYGFTLKHVQLDPRFQEEVVLGFKDSCSGDSGSPLWSRRQEDGRAVLVGLTSRGAAVCGEMNTPAIYTRIKVLLPWIEGIVGNATENSASVWHRSIVLLLALQVIIVVSHGRSFAQSS